MKHILLLVQWKITNLLLSTDCLISCNGPFKLKSAAISADKISRHEIKEAVYLTYL